MSTVMRFMSFIEEITEGYITEMKDYYDNNKIWKHEEILKVLEKNNILN